ncbi:MAG: lipoyl synthase [Candidatus Aminicenantaceae bacterium]
MELQPETQTAKKPSWLKVRFPSHKNFFYVSNLIKEKNIHTICQSAKCPNISECWSHKTATFLILGDTCTRNCGFCAVKKGAPSSSLSDEASHIAETVSLMGLNYVVITSVTRDDMEDGGAFRFAETISKIRETSPQAKVEALIPDFNGNTSALQTVIDAHPDILNHNLEVPVSLYPLINRPKSFYDRSLGILKTAAKKGMVTKSGLMIGLGEKMEDILQVFSDLKHAACKLLTLGQYLQPTQKHIRVQKYYSPLEFKQLGQIAFDFGFKDVVSGPLVRSSFQAQKMYDSVHENVI